jgi:hypothetical protein
MHVPRILISLLLSLLIAGTAAAQPPVDYTLVCDDGESQFVIGAASFVDGALRVSLVDGATCDGTVFVAQDTTLIVTLTVVDGVVTVTIADAEADPEFESEVRTAEAKELPPQAIAGMVTAQENRASAFAREGRGDEQSAAATDEHGPDLPEAAGRGRP